MKSQRIDWARLLVFVIFVQGTCLAIAQTPFQAWVQRYEAGTNGTRGGKCIGLDTNGNVFVSGSSLSGTNYAFATLAYSNTGTPLWTNDYAPGVLSAEPSALAVSSDGKVFVTGSSYTPSSPAFHPTGYQFATVAYSGSGAALWTNGFSEGGDARAVAIAVGQSGTVYVTGTSSLVSGSGISIMTTLAYSSAGVPIWTNHYQGATGQSSGPASITLDNQENVFVAGHAFGLDGYQHYAVVAYSNAGAQLWANQYIGPVKIGDAASALAVDANGNVFVTGAAYNTNGFSDYLTVAYSGAGFPLWTNRYASGNASVASAIAIDPSGTVFVTGRSWSAPGFPDYATVAYSAAGFPLWTNRYDGAVHRTDAPVAVAADTRGHVAVTGYSSTDSINSSDYITIGYNTTGAPLWTNRFDGPQIGYIQPSALAVDAVGNMFVTGTSWNGTNFEFATIKYALLQPLPLQVQRAGDQIVLSWTNAAFGLQASPTVSALFTNVSGATSPYTNQITGGGRFFRLISM